MCPSKLDLKVDGPVSRAVQLAKAALVTGPNLLLTNRDTGVGMIPSLDLPPLPAAIFVVVGITIVGMITVIEPTRIIAVIESIISKATKADSNANAIVVSVMVSVFCIRNAGGGYNQPYCCDCGKKCSFKHLQNPYVFSVRCCKNHSYANKFHNQNCWYWGSSWLERRGIISAEWNFFACQALSTAQSVQKGLRLAKRKPKR